MVNDSGDYTRLTTLILARRDAAARARGLAQSVMDTRAQEGLEKYALELEAEAAELEGQIAALNKAASDRGQAPNVVQIKSQKS